MDVRRSMLFPIPKMKREDSRNKTCLCPDVCVLPFSVWFGMQVMIVFLVCGQLGLLNLIYKHFLVGTFWEEKEEKG